MGPMNHESPRAGGQVPPAPPLNFPAPVQRDAAERTPADLARDTMRRLAREKLPPTPENFARIYQQIAGPADTKPAGDQQTHGSLALVSALAIPDTHKEFVTRAIESGAWHAVSGLVDDGLAIQRKAVAAQAGAGAKSDGDWPDTTVMALSCSSALYRKSPDLKRYAVNLIHTIRHVSGPDEHRQVRERLREFSGQLLNLQNDEERSNFQLKSLLSAIVKNVAGLSAQHSWLGGQMSRIDQALADGASEAALREVESTLRDAGRNQQELCRNLEEAKAALKDMVAVFMARLGEMAQSTDTFSSRIDHYAIAIESAETIDDVTGVVHCMLDDTRGLHSRIAAVTNELETARRCASEYEQKTVSLENELAKVSELVRIDQLTQTLNRDGFRSAFDEESAQAARHGNSLCLAVIDIDNFKALNLKHGHEAGNDALVHLSRVVRQAIRPTDVLARIGGEEFVVLMPDTGLDVAVGLSEKLQRQLTRQFFLHGLERLFVTFSAGVTRVEHGEIHEAALERAAKALAHAKRLGKNRVCAG